MAMRNIVQIDEEKCNGCGLCVSACAEGAIQLIDGKARLMKDDYCDGLGACLGECPQGAIAIIQRDAAAFDEQAVAQRRGAHAAPHGGGCPGSMMRQFAARPANPSPAVDAPSALRQWPVQLHLLSPTAPCLRDADLLLAADCAAFACGDFHARFLQDHALAIACPKLDDTEGYVEKLAAMIEQGGLRSIAIVRMEAPCCGGLERLAALAMQRAGREIPVRRVIVHIDGTIADR
jgi:Fe-S-cluster-containing hydrogenase component 2